MQLDRKTRRAPGISLTPLIDVVFILLLFFMLSTQFDQQRALTLNVPAKNSTPALAPDDNYLSIKLLSDNQVMIAGDNIINTNQLGTNDQLLAAHRLRSNLILDADDLVSVQALVSLTDTLSTMGFENVTLRALR